MLAPASKATSWSTETCWSGPASATGCALTRTENFSRRGVAGVAGIVDHRVGHLVDAGLGEGVVDFRSRYLGAVAEVPADSRRSSTCSRSTGCRRRRTVSPCATSTRLSESATGGFLTKTMRLTTEPLPSCGAVSVASSDRLDAALDLVVVHRRSAVLALAVAEAPDIADRAAGDVVALAAVEADGRAGALEIGGGDRHRPAGQVEDLRRQLEGEEPAFVVGDVERRVVGIFLAAAQRDRRLGAAIALADRERRSRPLPLARGGQRDRFERRGEEGRAEGGIEIADGQRLRVLRDRRSGPRSARPAAACAPSACRRTCGARRARHSRRP